MKAQTIVDEGRRRLLKASLALGSGLILKNAVTPPPAVAIPSADPTAPGRRGRGLGEASERIDGVVDLAIENVLAEGIDDVFARPFELDILAADATTRADVRNLVATRLRRGYFDGGEVSPIEHVLLPKRQPLQFRRCAILEPVDAIGYLALTLLAAPQVEAVRLSPRARRVFSYRFAPDAGYLFDPAYTYREFLRHVNHRIGDERVRCVATTDIESFYHVIEPGELRRSLRACAVDDGVCDYLYDLLAHWTCDPALPGLPVGSNASRILAEAVLRSIDDLLVAHAIDFARYVDDYRLFAPDARTARDWLTCLIGAFTAHGFAANQNKTRIFDAEEFRRIVDNERAVHLVEATETPAPLPPETAPKEPAGHKRAPAPRRKQAPDVPREPDGRSERYSSLAPSEFEPPGPHELAALRRLSLSKAVARLCGGSLADPADVRDFIKAALCRPDFRCIGRIPEVVASHPQCTGYAVNALLASAGALPRACRRDLVQAFAAALLRDPPAYLALHLVTFLGSPDYRDPATLVAYFSRLGSRARTYLGRTTLDALRAGKDIPRLPALEAAYVDLPPRNQRAALALWLQQSGAGVLAVSAPSAARDPFMVALLSRSEVVGIV